MKVIQSLFAFVLMLVFNTGALNAQSLSDLSGYIWKNNAKAVSAIQIAQKSLYSNDANPTSIVPVEVSEFKVKFYKGVQIRLQNNKDVPDAIWESYSETVQSQVDSKTSEEEQKQAFEQIIELLKD